MVNKRIKNISNIILLLHKPINKININNSSVKLIYVLISTTTFFIFLSPITHLFLLFSIIFLLTLHYIFNQQVNAPLYIVNISSEKSGDIISEYQSNGQRIYGEVESSAIGITGDPKKLNMVTSPPIRSHSDPSRLVALLAS